MSIYWFRYFLDTINENIFKMTLIKYENFKNKIQRK